MRIRQATATATIAAAALLLTACGGSPLEGKTGPQVADAAADAIEAAGSVHVAGTMTTDGQPGDIDLLLQGDDALGSITLNGTEIQLFSVGGAVYLQAPLAFWTAFGIPDGAAAMFENQWVTVPDDAAAGFEEFSLSGFAEELRNPSDGAIKEEVTAGEVDGADVVVVEQEGGGTLKVADDDPAYPLEMTNEGGSAGTVTFSRFGEKQDIAAPVNVLDLAELAGGA
jgi:hypothetical protein